MSGGGTVREPSGMKQLHRVLLRATRRPGDVYVIDGKIWHRRGHTQAPSAIQSTPYGRDLIAWGYVAEDPATGYLVPTDTGRAWLDEDAQRDNTATPRSPR